MNQSFGTYKFSHEFSLPESNPTGAVVSFIITSVLLSMLLIPKIKILKK